jgi:oligopeptide/dipeptide ABC transporter ATP-binding protein
VAGHGKPRNALLAVRGLSKHFGSGGFFSGKSATVRAVDGVDFEISEGETLALVGESGCGKSTTGRLVLRLIEPTAGRIEFEGTDLATVGGRRLLDYRRRMQIIFQDPFASLNPRMTAASIIGEPLRLHGAEPGKSIARSVEELLDMVGLPASHGRRYPHEFSGGQRQRIGIARALALRPRLVVCDEPVSALDVSVQAQIANLLRDIQAELGLSYLFISHDLMVVRHMADRVAVMYLGRIVETAAADHLFQSPRHPYTRALLNAIPTPDPARRRARPIVQGDVPSPFAPPPGCHFHPRCAYATDQCRIQAPAIETDDAGHEVACHRWRDIPAWNPDEVAAAQPDRRLQRLQSRFATGARPKVVAAVPNG